MEPTEKSKSPSRSFLRLFFWEALGLAGLLHLHFHPLADPVWTFRFFGGALFFLLAYPLLYLYRWKFQEGCLSLALWPFGLLLSLGLGVSLYFWSAYWLFYLGNPFAYSLMNHMAVLGTLFLFIHFPLLQPLLGVGGRYYSLWEVGRILLGSALGGVFGFYLGFFLDKKWGPDLGSQRFLLWLAVLLVGTALGAILSGGGIKKKGA